MLGAVVTLGRCRVDDRALAKRCRGDWERGRRGRRGRVGEE
ncbi:hypothetical protein GFS31_13400 [Leptolyngbya sp. BL0902]|nr:hypothetical protein GFS31_13400 [Leptolyngbya sp. BL0902]